MNQENHITEARLDILLNEVYLEINSHASNELEANFVLNSHYPCTINADKEKELFYKLQQATQSKKINYWLYIILVVLSFLIGVIAYLYVQNQPTQSVNTTLSQASHTNNNTIVASSKKQVTSENTSVLSNTHNDTFPKNSDVNFSTLLKDTASNTQQLSNNSYHPIVKQILPYLPTKDKINYAHIKEQLIRNLWTLNKAFYTKIPSNKITYSGKPLVIDGFSIRNMAISNLEYKAFLADLISQNRTSDYFKAQVLSETWLKYNCHQIASFYFQDERYNDFPVVNVSYEGAFLFCKWLQEELEVYTIQHHIKNNGIQIRLPYCEEWICAARDGYAKISYEKGYHTMYDISEGLVDKSFANRQEKIRHKNQQSDSLYDVFTANYYGADEISIMTTISKGLSYYPHIELDTLNASKMKTLNKHYKTSEITNRKNSTQYWLSGQTWKDKAEYLKFEQEFKNNSCSPFVGFRFIVINPNEPEYKNPFW